MALEYVGGALATGSTGPLTVSLTALTGGIGASAQPGDLVVVASGFVGTAEGQPGVTTAGYTPLAQLYADASARDTNLAVACKLLTDAEGSVTCLGSGVASNGAVAVAHVWRGVDPVAPLDVAIATASGLNTRAMNSPPVTPVTDGAVVLSIGAAVSTAGFNSTVPPAGYANHVFRAHDPGTAFGCGIASKSWAGTGPEDPPNWGSTGGTSGDSWAAATLVLRPAAASGGASHDRAADVAAVSETAASAVLRRTVVASADVSAAAALSAAASTRRLRGGLVDATTALGAAPLATRSRAVAIASASALSASQACTRARSAAVAGASSARTSAGGAAQRMASVTATSGATAAGLVTRRRAAPAAPVSTAQAGRVVSRAPPPRCLQRPP